jgi:hypothetical protein
MIIMEDPEVDAAMVQARLIQYRYGFQINDAGAPLAFPSGRLDGAMVPVSILSPTMPLPLPLRRPTLRRIHLI